MMIPYWYGTDKARQMRAELSSIMTPIWYGVRQSKVPRWFLFDIVTGQMILFFFWRRLQVCTQSLSGMVPKSCPNVMLSKSLLTPPAVGRGSWPAGTDSSPFPFLSLSGQPREIGRGNRSWSALINDINSRTFAIVLCAHLLRSDMYFFIVKCSAVFMQSVVDICFCVACVRLKRIVIFLWNGTFIMTK